MNSTVLRFLEGLTQTAKEASSPNQTEITGDARREMIGVLCWRLGSWTMCGIAGPEMHWNPLAAIVVAKQMVKAILVARIPGSFTR